MNKITLTKDNFQTLLDIMSLIKDDHNDMDIRKGVMRQLSLNRVYIFEADLKSIIGENDLVLPMIKSKVSLLQVLNSDNIELNIDEKNYVFSDSVSELKFISNTSEYLDNKYMSLEDVNNIFKLDDSQISFSLKIDRFLQNKIKVFSDNFNVDDLMINIEDNKAELQILSFSNVGNAKIVKDIPVSNIFEKSRICISVKPFILDYKNEMDMIVYKIDDQKVIVKLNSKINETSFTIYIIGFLEQM